MPAIGSKTKSQSHQPFDLDHLQQSLSIDLRCTENELRNNSAVAGDVAAQLAELVTQVESLADEMKALNRSLAWLEGSDVVDHLATIAGKLTDLAEAKQDQPPRKK